MSNEQNDIVYDNIRELLAEIGSLKQDILSAIQAMQDHGSPKSIGIYETLCAKYSPEDMSPAFKKSLEENT